MSDYPKIWDRAEERRIVGETTQSWIVIDVAWEVEDLAERLKDPWFLRHSTVKVNKKDPNKGCSPRWPSWFLYEHQRANWLFIQAHREKISRAVSTAALSANELRKIAEICGYKIEEDKP